MPSCNQEGNGRRIRDAGSDGVLTEPTPGCNLPPDLLCEKWNSCVFQLLLLRLPVTCPCHNLDVVSAAGHIGRFQSFNVNNDDIMTIHTHTSRLQISCIIE